ncbi:MAG: polysaccharide deacetylase family protein [Janthinobacterium lividum]
MSVVLPPGWPEARTLAVSVSVMLEGWSEGAAPGVGPMGNVLKAGTLDLQGRSWAEYGAKAGAWRLLDILAAEQVRAVFYVSGVLAEQYPDLMRAIVGAGHNLAAHGWSQHIVPATQDEAAEQADLQRCLTVLESAGGMRPRGWISPRCTPSAHTTELLRAAGLTWHSDFFDEDLPRVVQTASGSITAVPFTMEVNDMPMSVRYGNEPEAYTRTLQRILEGWASLPPRPACLDVTVHAHVYGRPMGAIEFANSLRAVKASGSAFLTEHDALGAMFAA